jgi:hypothetical protein
MKYHEYFIFKIWIILDRIRIRMNWIESISEIWIPNYEANELYIMIVWYSIQYTYMNEYYYSYGYLYGYICIRL